MSQAIRKNPLHAMKLGDIDYRRLPPASSLRHGPYLYIFNIYEYLYLCLPGSKSSLKKKRTERSFQAEHLCAFVRKSGFCPKWDTVHITLITRGWHSDNLLHGVYPEIVCNISSCGPGESLESFFLGCSCSPILVWGLLGLFWIEARAEIINSSTSQVDMLPSKATIQKLRIGEFGNRHPGKASFKRIWHPCGRNVFWLQDVDQAGWSSRFGLWWGDAERSLEQMRLIEFPWLALGISHRCKWDFSNALNCTRMCSARLGRRSLFTICKVVPLQSWPLASPDISMFTRY